MGGGSANGILKPHSDKSCELNRPVADAAFEPSIGKAKLDLLKRMGVHFAAGNRIGPHKQAGSTRQEVEGLQRRNPWIPRKRAEGDF
jgi:hypothetical protein